MASKCQKFVPNMFNKSKCQHCFAAKEAHSAAALENNKASRKVSKCGYLFVSPGFDFNNPLDRSRRWQRRFFRLYDDGEFSYCVDENPDTVPQGIVDMNKCTEVLDAQSITTHSYSLSIVTPEKTLFIKGNSKEEIQWWHDVLAEFPKALKNVKPRRKQPCLILSSNKEQEIDSVDGICEGKIDFKSDAPAYVTFKGVRSLKHKYDNSYQEGLRKSSSLHDLSSENPEMRESLESSRYLSRSGDRLDTLTRESIYSLARNTPVSVHKSTVPHSPWMRSSSLNSNVTRNVASSHSSISSSSSTTSDRQVTNTSKNANGKLHRERSSSLRDFSTQFSLLREGLDKPLQAPDETDSNQTDELKIAQSSEVKTSARPIRYKSSSTSSVKGQSVSNKLEDLVYMKKGWLIKQASTEKESHKHWFVLAGNSLRYYEDAKAEEANILEGRIDLSTCYEVAEISTHRNYGFKIKTGNGEYILAAMTLGIRTNWMKALRLCMELHSSIPKWKLSSNASPSTTLSQQRSALDDLEFKTSCTSLTAAVKGVGGETAFQLVGHKDPYKKEVPRQARRHHSDVNPSNVSKVFSVKEFSPTLEPAKDSPVINPLTGDSSALSTAKNNFSGAKTLGSSLESTPKSARSISREGVLKLKRDATDSSSLTSSSGAAAQGPEQILQTPKRNITSESNKEEVKREMMRYAKAPSARIKEKTRVSKSTLSHSSISSVEDAYGFHLASDAGSAMSDTTNDPTFNDSHMSEEDSEDYPAHEDTDNDEVGSATASDVIADDALVEILETEVETLKDRLELTQTELDKIHKDNLDLKSRLHKESIQSVDSGYSSRWGGQNTASSDSNNWLVPATNNNEMLKRHLKEAKDTIQRQKMDIEGLKSKLDMSVSKLTGTEKALSEALRDCKQEKDKFGKLSSEFNRRIRSMENQSKDTVHKLERNRETLQAKERECRRLEAELKTNLQRTREQEREILKLKAVEHEYNQLKEKLDDREHELANLKSEMKEKEHFAKKIKDDYESHLEELDREFVKERDDLENHVEQLKLELYSAHDRQASMTDNMTSNIADILKEKDDIIAQLEEKMIEADKKLVDLSEELHAEMGENADLAHSIDMLQKDQVKFTSTIEELNTQLMAMRTKVSGLESDNTSLRRQLQELRIENTQLHEGFCNQDIDGLVALHVDKERDELRQTVVELNRRLFDLQTKMEQVQIMADKKYERGGSVNSISSLASDHQQDLLHNVLIVDSQLKEISATMYYIHQCFDTYIESLPEREHSKVMKLSNLIENVCHKCKETQDILREGGGPAVNTDYSHVITVNAQTNGKIIMEEYFNLKEKFDLIVAELRKLKFSSVDSCKSCDAKQEEAKLKEKLTSIQTSYSKQLDELTTRVEKLGAGQTSSGMSTTKENTGVSMNDIEAQLSKLEKQILSLEKVPSTTKPVGVTIQQSEELDKLSSMLQTAHSQIEAVVAQAKQTNTLSSPVLFKLESSGKRIDSLSSNLHLPDKTSMTNSKEASQMESTIVAGGVMNCLKEIREKVQEIGEQLDLLDEEDEDSDSENEGDQTTVNDIRDRLAQLTEYIEEHSKLDTSDWALLRLVTLHKESLAPKIENTESINTDIDSTKLKLFSDKLALEAVILSEMSHILQARDYLSPPDIVNKEIDMLNSQMISLYQMLDNEMKTMHFEEQLPDVFSSYIELVAEKILINGHLCSSLFDQKSHISVKSDTPSSIQPGLLAVEALERSQIDSFISTNLDRTSKDILDIPTHLTNHAIVQGELTFALRHLKAKLVHWPEALEPGAGNHQFILSQLLQRQKRIGQSFDSYFKQIVHSLAVIIFKESEEMTIVQGPESVMESMCSELSTIIETHIQSFKENCRNAQNTHIAHKYDLIVNELRSVREATLSEIKLKHEAYVKNQTDIRDSSLDIPVQSLDNTIKNFGEILALKAIMMGSSVFVMELIKMGSSVLSDLELDLGDMTQVKPSLEKGLFSYVNVLCQSLEEEALSKYSLSKKVMDETSSDHSEEEGQTLQDVVLQIPDLSGYSGLAEVVVREAVHSAQLTFSLFKQKLTYDRELSRTKGRRYTQAKHDQESGDSEEALELQADIQALLGPIEEVLESKHEDELEVLDVLLAMIRQIKLNNLPSVEEQVKQLELKLQHEQEVAKDRHNTYLEVFKQETSKLEKTLEELQSERDHYLERSEQLEEDLNILQIQHEEEKEREKQDILTAVHAIKSNDEKSGTHLLEKSSRLEKELVMQKIHFRKLLGSLKKDLATKDKSNIIQGIEEHMKLMSLSSEEEEEEDYQPPLPSQPPPNVTVPEQSVSPVLEVASKPLNFSSHEHAVELLRREKEEALAEEIRNTKAALDAVRSAYEDELTKEKDKYKEALRTMFTEDFVEEIRLRHQEEENRMREELQKLNMHYSSKCEDYKLLEMKLQQTKQDYESHISQLISSNDHLEELLNREIDSLKDFIKNKPSSLTTGSVTMEEELYDAKIMVRVKDTELQKLRSQVKNLENNLHRTTEEHRQTMTLYMQTMKSNSELKKQHQEEVSQLTDKLNKVLGSQGLKANIRRTPSFHQRTRSPSPGNTASVRKESDHSSRDSHRRRHIHPKDLRRSKSSPSLPFVFDNKAISPKPATLGSTAKSRRSRSPKS
nr:golgin subfamily A member 4-like [Biomphalaria glabrata]